MNRLAVLLAVFSAGAMTAQESHSLELRWPATPAIAWSGIAADEVSSWDGGPMYYPATSAVGGLAMILAHALIANASQSQGESNRQAAAAKLLTPYQKLIDDLSVEQLTPILKARLAELPAVQDAAKLVQIKPHFKVARDQGALLLDMHIRISDASNASFVGFDGDIQVVASPPSQDETVKQWLDDDARALREQIVAMLAHGIELALQKTRLTPEPQAHTQRYRFGSKLRMERGQTIAVGCGRVVLLTLRQSWMSVPVTPVDPTTCTDRYQVAIP